MNMQILKGYDNYILFGSYQMGRQALKQLRAENVSVLHFCDNDSNKWGTTVDGLKVISPAELPQVVKSHNCLVIITSSYAKHLIASQLDEQSIPYIYFSKPIFVELTSFCNQNCSFCPYEFIEREKGNLDWEIVKRFLYDLRSDKSDVLYPVLYPHMMGEPLVSKHLFDFLDLCKELGFYAIVVTNFALMDERIQKKLFTEYENLDVVLSLQGPTEDVFHWRREPKLSYKEWIDRMFEVIEAKFKYGHGGLIQICTIWPEVVNNILIRSEEDLHIFEWFKSKEDFEDWKREFGQRCVDFAAEIKRKYPENYERASKVENPVSYYYNIYWLLRDLDEWVSAEGPAQFEFLPNVHIYGKKFGLWGVEKYFKSLLPEDKYFHWEENWHAMSEKCDRVGDVTLLSSGQLVTCNIDNEGDFVFADLSAGENYTDPKTQERIKNLRENLSLSALCRRCKSRVHVFDASPLENATVQDVTHYGIRWHKKATNADGEVYKVSYELSYAFVMPRIDATCLEVDVASIQVKKQFTLVKILGYDDETRLFTECKVFSFQLKPDERKKILIPYTFEQKKLYRIDFITATQRDDGVDNGVAVYGINLRKNKL